MRLRSTWYDQVVNELTKHFYTLKVVYGTRIKITNGTTNMQIRWHAFHTISLQRNTRCKLVFCEHLGTKYVLLCLKLKNRFSPQDGWHVTEDFILTIFRRSQRQQLPCNTFVVRSLLRTISFRAIIGAELLGSGFALLWYTSNTHPSKSISEPSSLTHLIFGRLICKFVSAFCLQSWELIMHVVLLGYGFDDRLYHHLLKSRRHSWTLPPLLGFVGRAGTYPTLQLKFEWSRVDDVPVRTVRCLNENSM